MRRDDPVDAALDLGIALEAMFLNDDDGGSGELSFRLKTRAARFLGANENERTELFKFVGEIYTVRSKAAHTGRINPKLTELRGQSLGDVLQKGFDLAARAARHFIEKGPPNWDHILFGE